MDARVTPLCLDVKDEMNGIAALDVHPHWRYVLDTGGRRPGADAGLCVSIHALRKEGDDSLESGDLVHIDISIHALREEGDGKPGENLMERVLFLSTPSARRATRPFAHPAGRG